MLYYQLEALDGAGVRECVIVVGCCADLVRETIGARFGNVAISYVENEIHDRTNNIYSLWLARRSIVDDILLLEGDLVFEPGLLLDLLDAPYDNVAVVDQYNSTMNGTVIQAGRRPSHRHGAQGRSAPRFRLRVRAQDGQHL